MTIGEGTDAKQRQYVSFNVWTAGQRHKEAQLSLFLYSRELTTETIGSFPSGKFPAVQSVATSGQQGFVSRITKGQGF